jgi:hypothetical protein
VEGTVVAVDTSVKVMDVQAEEFIFILHVHDEAYVGQGDGWQVSLGFFRLADGGIGFMVN